MAASWAVTSQRQTTVSDGNTFVQAVIVGFQTGAGNKGNVTIQAADYTSTSKVAAVIQEAANLMDEVSGLSSGTVDTSGFLSD
jgi:hypothetical protein